MLGAAVAGQLVEQLGDLARQLLAGREEPEVRVEVGGAAVVVARADVRVVAHALALAAHDEHGLRVRLESRQPIRHVHARLLQRARPGDVRALVEARRQLDEADGLLAAFGGADQRRDERRVVARAVHRLLDREHVGVVRRLLDELLDGRERVVRVVDEHVAPAQQREQVGALAVLGERARDQRRPRRLAQLAQGGRGRDLHDLPQVGEVEQARDLVDVALLDPEVADEPRPQRRVDARAHLQPHDLAEAPPAQLRLDRLEQVVGLVGDGEVGVARDAKGRVRDDLHAAEEAVEVVGDHGLHRHERAAPLADPDEARQPLLRHLHAREARLVARRVAHEHAEAE